MTVDVQIHISVYKYAMQCMGSNERHDPSLGIFSIVRSGVVGKRKENRQAAAKRSDLLVLSCDLPLWQQALVARIPTIIFSVGTPLFSSRYVICLTLLQCTLLERRSGDFSHVGFLLSPSLYISSRKSPWYSLFSTRRALKSNILNHRV